MQTEDGEQPTLTESREGDRASGEGSSLPNDDSLLATIGHGSTASEEAAVISSSGIRVWLAAFERACKAGEAVRLGEFFARAISSGEIALPGQRQQLLHELIAVELEQRWQRQLSTLPDLATLTEETVRPNPPRLEDYEQLLEGQFGPRSSWPPNLILEEYRIRLRFGDRPELQEYDERFPNVAGLRDRLRKLDDERPQLPADGMAGGSPIVLRGDYELRREIARGGMGIVYEAWQRSLKRTVAVKMIRAGEFASPDAVRRFQAEAQAAARLNHPHIVPVYEVGRDGGQHFFSMGYVDGQSLSAGVAKRGPLAPLEAAQLMLHVAAAVEYAHCQGVVHRDLKPQNVLLDKDHRPLVTDFGLAKHVNEDGFTLDGQIVGTPSFMSPEQAQGKLDQVGPLSDVYSLGALLYYLMTGRPPFHTASIPETLRQVVDLEPVAPRSLNPEVGRDLETICLKCLEKNPAQRYASARHLADDLSRYARGDEILARSTSWLEKSWRWCRRRPAAAALAATLLLVFSLGIPAIVWNRGRLAAFQAEKLAADASARLAEQQAKAARQTAEAAQQLADTQTYFATVSGVRQIIDRGRPGWSRQALARLQQAAVLPTPSRSFAELRSEAIACLMGIDLGSPRELAKGMHAAQVAFSRDGQWLAVGEFKDWLNCDVRILEVATGKAVHEIGFLGRPVLHHGELAQDGCRQLSFSPDRRWLAAGARSGHVHVWDLSESPPQLFSWRPHETEIIGLLFSRDGSRLYTAAHGDNVAKAWSPHEQWSLAGKHAMQHKLRQVTLPPGEGLLLNCSDDVQLANADLGNATRLELTKPGYTIATPWSRVVLVGSRRGLELHDLARPNTVKQYSDPNNLSRDFEDFRHAEFSDDGRLLLAITDRDEKVSLWNSASGKLVFDATCEPDVPLAARLSGNGRWLAMVASNSVLVHELRPQVLAATMTPGAMLPETFQWASADAAGSERQRDPAAEAARLLQAGLIRLDTSAGPIFLTDEDGEIAALAIHQTSGRVALSTSRAVRIWDPANDHASPVVELPVPNTSHLAFSPEGRLWGISNSLDAWRWAPGDDRPAPVFSNKADQMLSGRSTLLALSAARDCVLIGGRQGELIHVAQRDVPPRRFRLNVGPVTCVAIAPDEQTAVFGSQDGEVRLVGLPSCQSLAELAGHDDRVSSVTFSGDGRLLATTSHDRALRVWRKQGGNWSELFTCRFFSPVLRAQFHPRTATLAVHVQGEPAVRLLDFESVRSRLAEFHLDW